MRQLQLKRAVRWVLRAGLQALVSVVGIKGAGVEAVIMSVMSEGSTARSTARVGWGERRLGEGAGSSESSK